MSDRFFPYEFDQRWKALFLPLRVGPDDGVTGFNPWSFVVAVGGAVLLLVLYRAIRRR